MFELSFPPRVIHARLSHPYAERRNNIILRTVIFTEQSDVFSEQ
jgi:hypothetical protein